MKSPPVQYHDDIARNRTEEFIKKNRKKPRQSRLRPRPEA